MIAPISRTEDTYKLECHRCHRYIEFPVRTVQHRIGYCPLCGAPLEIEWRDA